MLEQTVELIIFRISDIIQEYPERAEFEGKSLAETAWGWKKRTFLR
jgi:hypothetical protein